MSGTAPDRGRLELPVMVDGFGRTVEYLRVSVTDKCNLRCVYCMPGDMSFRLRDDLLREEEIGRLVTIFADLGFRVLPGKRRTPSGNPAETTR